MQSAQKTVVVGDHDAIVLALVCHILQREGYKTHPVVDREELLRVLREGRYDAAVVDAALEGVVEAAKAVPGPSRIILTASHNGLDDVGGVHAILRKPLEFSQLIATVRDCVAQGE